MYASIKIREIHHTGASPPVEPTFLAVRDQRANHSAIYAIYASQNACSMYLLLVHAYKCTIYIFLCNECRKDRIKLTFNCISPLSQRPCSVKQHV